MPYISIDNTNRVTGIYARKQKSIETIEYNGEVEIGWYYNPDTKSVSAPAMQGGMTLSKYKENRVNDVIVLCQQKIESGFTSSSLGSPHKYQSEFMDQFNTLANVTIAQSTASNVLQKCTKISDGVTSWKEHTPAQILQVFAEGGAHVVAMLQRKDVLAAEIKAAASFEEVDAINITYGW